MFAFRGVRRSLSVWSRQPNVPPALAALLEDGVGRGLAARSELAIVLSASWRAEAIGEPVSLEGGGGTALAFALRTSEGVDLALMRSSMWAAERTGDVATAVLFAPQCHPALPLSIAAVPLIDAACSVLRTEHGAERVTAIAALPGLCQWVVETAAWESEGVNAEQRAAVEASDSASATDR